MIKNILKLNSKRSGSFWSGRHLEYDKDVWAKMYYESDTEYRKIIYHFFEHLNSKNIFEFGCNSGPNAKIAKKLSIQFYTGIDINLPAIKFAREVFKNDNYLFITQLMIEKKLMI